jgi:hypothetical protein
VRVVQQAVRYHYHVMEACFCFHFFARHPEKSEQEDDEQNPKEAEKFPIRVVKISIST